VFIVNRIVCRSDLLTLNDKLAFELADDSSFSEEERKQWGLVPPRVCVMGLTSAGKSSLLERIIGFRIFPVKDSVCTRRPFSVHLKHDPTAGALSRRLLLHYSTSYLCHLSSEKAILRFSNVSDGKSDAKSAAAPTVEYVLPDDLDKVRKVLPLRASRFSSEPQRRVLYLQIIEDEQGSSKDDVVFSSKEIHAEIRSRNCETFTFTDLPGIFLLRCCLCLCCCSFPLSVHNKPHSCCS
jgi:hypothetical protein